MTVPDRTRGRPSGGEDHRLGAAPTLPGRRSSEERGVRRQQRSTAATVPVGSDDGAYVQVFEPSSRSVTAPRRYVRELWARRPFLAALAKADIRGSRSSTALGSVWGLVDPIFQSAIYYFLFVVIRGGEDGRPIEFLPLLVGGIFLFRLTTAAITDGGKSVKSSSGLMLKSTFPRAILPLSSVYKGLLLFTPSIFVFAGVYLWLGEPLHRGLLWMPVLFAIQVVTNVGLALAMSTLLVFFRDAQNALSYVTRILFFTTPVIYPISLLPEGVVDVLVYQPLFPLFASYQHVLGGGSPQLGYVVAAVAWAVFFVVLGGWVFLRHEREMAARL